MTIRSIVAQIIPPCYEREHIKSIRARLLAREKKDQQGTAIDPTWEKYLLLERLDLQDSLRIELARREFVHRRSQTFLSSIAVMTAFTIGSTSALRASQHLVPTWLMAPAILLAFLYLAGGGWYALETVRPGMQYDLFVQNRMLGDRPKNVDELKLTLVKLIQMNQALNLVFATLAERTYRCIRNGVIVLVAVLTMLVIDSARSIPKQTEHNKKVSSHLEIGLRRPVATMFVLK